MEQTEVTIEDPIVLNGLTIIPVVSLSLHGWHFDNFATVCGDKKPLAFLVISSAERRAYGVSGEELSTDQLIEEFPDLKEILERRYSVSGLGVAHASIGSCHHE